jgi:2-polyprenyl-3-methyl-5-hydroxy-6-metoxy-1,4-benzoquinol methylase
MIARLIKHAKWRWGLVVYFFDRERKRKDRESAEFTKLMSANNKEVFEQMYSSTQMLGHYLVEDRLDFYNKVAGKVSSYFHGNVEKSSCLDVGCGTGHLLVAMRHKGFLGQLVGIDTAEAAKKRVLEHGVNLEFYAGYLSDYGWKSKFDLILCTEVLEHCDYPEDIIKEMIQVAKPGGVIVITVPDGRKDTWEGHVHFWSPESFKIFINSFGMRSEFDYFDNTNFCAINI